MTPFGRNFTTAAPLTLSWGKATAMDEVKRQRDQAARWRRMALQITDAKAVKALVELADALEAKATARWHELRGHKLPDDKPGQ
jgi:hypothetical protein